MLPQGHGHERPTMCGVTRSDDLFRRATTLIPGGVSSPVRAFGAVGGTPPFIERGEGAYLVDVDGIRYIDLVQSWGALLFGHARREIVQAATDAAALGTSFGAPTEREVGLAARIVKAVPGVELVRLVSSGTEAAMSAVRLARGFTGRDLVVKFGGCYHGHSDALLAKGAGSGPATFGIPGSPGVTDGTARDTITTAFNDLDGARALFASRGDDVACAIVEPVAANMGVVPPEPGFLEGLREICTANGALLIFDEVITGFRIAFRGAQSVFGVTPDLTVLGKVMGGGFPCAAFGGRRDVMEALAPNGPVYQAGTLSGNPVAVAAGIAALDLARDTDPYPQLEKTADELIAGLGEAFGHADVPTTINRAGSMFSVFFTGSAVRDFDGAREADHERYARFFHHMLDRGVYLPPSGYELWTLGTAHGPAEVGSVIEAAGSFTG
jgi:glutamate-1-semialdehyde 2,1-aminomutase